MTSPLVNMYSNVYVYLSCVLPSRTSLNWQTFSLGIPLGLWAAPAPPLAAISCGTEQKQHKEQPGSQESVLVNHTVNIVHTKALCMSVLRES